MRIDVLILGGGAAGLWLLDELHRRGFRVLLAEAVALGAGQTIASQGIIHGGIKYTLRGLFDRSAESIREMPDRWRSSHQGHTEPDLREARLLSSHCYLWRTDSLGSRFGLMGARLALRTPVVAVDVADRPAMFAGCPGDVIRVDEPVFDTRSLVAALARKHDSRLLLTRESTGMSFSPSGSEGVGAVTLRHPDSERTVTIHPSWLILTAGEGNAALRARLGLDAETMQRRPLHMAMIRGPLPMLYGHCVDGARTRVTITSVKDTAGNTVWQVGGQLAEDGVSMACDELLVRTRSELKSVLPAVDFSSVEWATYRIDRAEGRTAGGGRPDDVTVTRDGPVITAWPTKLALVPRLAAVIADQLGTPRGAGSADELPSEWPRPTVAMPPWERTVSWRR